MHKMHKFSAVSMVLVFLLSSWSFADVGQIQTFIIGGDNSLGLIEGAGAAANANLMTVELNQLTTDDGSGVTALQFQVGAVIQGANAAGGYGLLGAVQDGQAVGAQVQTIPPGEQLQYLNAELPQLVFKIGGIGAALGVQSFTGVQVQHILTPFGISANVQYMGVAAIDGIGGGPNNNSILSKGINISGGQQFR